jgi:serine/threonine-protein kinase
LALSIASGTKLGQYEVQDFLGQGAMGLVYRAYHAQLERTGAVKVMQAISPDADSVARFRHEAQAIAQMRHPNIVNVYDFGEFQGTPYMIVEYVPGGNLATRLSHGILDQATALKYLRGIAAGLDHAHSHGIVHRDVKPANVLLTAEDTPVLVDFGLAKLLQGSSLKSMTGVTTGTPAYMAPEQVAGSKVGPAADRYALASIAYEMFTGVIPFDGEGLMELLYAQVHREPLPPSARYPLLSTQVDAVIMRGLAKDPTARWESCSGFVDALSVALGAAPAPAMAQTVVVGPALASTVPMAGAAVAERVAAPPQPRTVAMAYTIPAPTTPMAAAPAKRKRRMSPRLLFGVAAILALLLVLGVCSVALAGTTLTVNPSTVTRGDNVAVTATHVPANQVGEIQLWSVVHTYPFRANANGDVSVEIIVPRDIALGDHTVKICWNNACRKETPLRVVYGVAEVPTTPVANATASPGQHTSPSPGSSPRPGSTPTARPTSGGGSTPQPTSPPAATPKPTPTPSPPSPTPNPCPISASSAYLTTSGGSILVPAVTVKGHYFTPNKSVVVRFYFPSSSATAEQTVYGPVSCDGSFTVSFTPNPLDIGTGSVTAYDNGSPVRHADTTVSVS